MNKAFSSIILTLSWLAPSAVLALDVGSLNSPSSSIGANLLARGGGGGARGGGGGGGGMSRPSGSGGMNRPSGSGGNFNLNSDRNGSNRVNKPATPVNNQGNRDRVNNFSNNNSGNRNLNLNNEHNYSNRVQNNNIGNRTNINNNNVNRYNVNRNNVVINNPRGWNNWSWHGGAPWYPSTGYWGGGFWGGFAVGAVTGAAIAAASQPQYYVVQTGTPGYILLNNYNLVQTPCGGEVVIINGPSGSLICARPTVTIPIGTYTVEPSNLTLIPQY
jgi:hypothetical protein